MHPTFPARTFSFIVLICTVLIGGSLLILYHYYESPPIYVSFMVCLFACIFSLMVLAEQEAQRGALL